MTHRSIRWRLPLSYALIALVATLVLGTVLITTLRDYYAQREIDFLARHAIAASQRVEQMLEEGQPLGAIQAEFVGLSFLAQTHIRLMDTDGQVLVDSGAPGSQQAIVSYTRRDDGELVDVPEIEFIPATAPEYEPLIYLDDNGNTIRIIPSHDGQSISITALASPVPQSGTIHYGVAEPSAAHGVTFPSGLGPFDVVQQTRPVMDAFWAGPASWMMAVEDGDTNGTLRSSSLVSVPVTGTDGDLWGMLEMSDGLAYGSAIVEKVTSGWLLASAVAVVLAAGVGWFISRSLSAPLIALTEVTSIMAKGDLSARARVNRHDEIGRLAQSFNEMADRVEDTVSVLRRFVGDAAHELHTPLTALNANLELAAQETDETRRRAFVQRAREQVRRMVTLSSDLLDLSRFESNRMVDERSGVNLSAIVREMGEVYASRAEQKGISFSHELPNADVRVQAHEGQLRRVVANLLDNAIKFTPEDGSVAVGLTTREQQVELWVRDTGIGIPQEDLPLLFNRFHRGRNTAAYAGSGLGLAITRTIVEAHQGAVTVESGTHGTRFAVQLPATG
jgi:signal transduction histidine kinase